MCAVSKFQAERLKQSRCDPLPSQSVHRVVQPGHHPDVAVPGADGRSFAIRVEVESGQPELSVPGVVLGQCERIDGERSIVLAESSPQSSKSPANVSGRPR